MGVVVVGNEKGGTGKTTCAVNLAAHAACAGVDVLLVDADPGQQSAAKWAAVRRELHPSRPQVRCVTLHGGHIRAELADFAGRYGAVVVDTGASDSAELRAAALVADFLVVPVQADDLDLWALPTMELIYDGARALNPKLRVVVAINRVPHQAMHSADEIRAWMADNAPKLPTGSMVTLVGRAAYGRASGIGVGGGGDAEGGREGRGGDGRPLQGGFRMTRMHVPVPSPTPDPPPAASQAEQAARFVRAASGKVTYPWQEPHVRTDLKVEVNTRQPEDVILQLHFLAAETKRPKREVIEEALRRYVAEELRRMGIER